MPPVLNSIAPQAGPAGAMLNLLGSGFSSAAVQIVSQDPDFPLTSTLTPVLQSASAITVQLPASLPGQANGAIDLFVAVVNGDASSSAQLTFSVTFVGWTTIGRVAGEVPAFKRGGENITDDAIWGWIRSRSQEIIGAMLKRGYSLDPSQWPAVGPGGGSPEACNTLEGLNRYGAGYDLASKVGAQFSAGGEWILAKNLRDLWVSGINALKAGDYDHLFRTDAATEQVAPSFGGVTHGRQIFKVEQKF